MTIDRNTLLFFDASCLIAAAGRPSGGSGFLLALCGKGFLKAAVSQPVLLEAQRNIQLKLGEAAFGRLYRFLAVVPFILAPVPQHNELEDFNKVINVKDAHVVAATQAVHAQFLLTLDIGLIIEVNRAIIGIQACMPGDFIKSILPTHIQFPTDRD